MQQHGMRLNPSVYGSATPRRSRLVLALLFGVALLNYVDRSIISILQEPIKRDLHLSDTQLGALTGLSFALLYATLALPVARLADRGNRTRLLAACLVVWSIMTALVHSATGFWALVVLRMGVALGEAGSGPTTHSIIGDIVPSEQRGSALAIMALAVPAGTMLGFLSAGWLATFVGWRNTFLILGVVGLAIAPLVWLLREPARPQAPVEFAAGKRLFPQSGRATISLLLEIPAFRLLLVAATCQTFVLYGFQSWAAPFYARVHHLSIGEIGTALALMFGIGGGAGAYLGGYLVDLLGRRDANWFGRIPALASLFAFPCLLAQFLVPSTPAAIAFGFATMFCMNVFIAPTNAAAQASVPSHMRAMTSAMLLAIPTIVGVGFGPLLTGMASDLITARTHAADAIRYAAIMPTLALLAAAFAFHKTGHALRIRFADVGRF